MLQPTLNNIIVGGIYCIEDARGRLYYGSSVNIDRRIKSHIYALSSNRHENKKLQNIWNAHGETYFSFYPVQLVLDVNTLIEVEQLWLDLAFNTLDAEYRYNINPIASKPPMMGGWNKGIPQTEEQKARHSATMRGKKQTPDVIERRSKANKGKKRSAEFKIKMSDLNRGKVLSPEHRAKLSAAKLGKKRLPMSEETKAKISAAHKGKTLSEETRARLSAVHKTRGTMPPSRKGMKKHDKSEIKS